MKGGFTIKDQNDNSIRTHDKLLLVLSEKSMDSNWVETEIIRVMKKEKQEGRRALFPISIVDDFQKIIDWELFDPDTGKDIAREVRAYFTPDFSNWKDHDSFQGEFKRLMESLKAD